jgi:protoporphyrinogen oxidase/uncharacterized membrane protein
VPDAGDREETVTHTAVVGGGMLGLAVALGLLERGERVTIFEAASELGGLAAPFTIGDLTWDRFYHIIVPRDRRLLDLIETLGLEPELKWSTPKTGFYTDGGFHSMSNVAEFLSFKPLTFIDKLRLGAAIVYASRFGDPLALENVTAERWLTRVCGPRTFEKIWRPLLRAKLGDNYPDVSAAFIWATIVRYYGARKQGVGRDECGYVAGGYARILDVLQKRIGGLGVETVLGSRISAIRRGPGGPLLEFEGAEPRAFDRVVVTIAAPVAAKLCVDLTDDERARLASKRYMGIVCVSLVLDRPLGSFYVTNLTDEWVPFSAVIDMAAVVDRSQFGDRGLVYLPKYVPPGDPLFGRTDDDVVAEFVAALERMYPDFSASRVVEARVSRAPAVFAMPTLGYSQSVPAISTSVPGLYTVNSAQIVNATLVVDETLRLADRAIEATAQPAPEPVSSPAPSTRSVRALPAFELSILTPTISACIAGAVLLFTGNHIRQDFDISQQQLASWSCGACWVLGFVLLVYGSLAGVAGNRKENAAVAGLLFSFLAYATTWIVIHTGTFGTDAVLFNVYSARIAAHGGNPYAQSMEPAFALFGVSKTLVTPTAGGGAIFLQSYPALAFLLYVPIVLAGIDPQWVDVAAHVALMLTLVAVAPRPLKALAMLVVFADHSYADYTLGGVTDIVWVLLIALSARFWNANTALCALFLGLACAAKQPPWFVAPFALVAWASQALERRRPAAFFGPLAVFGAAFIVPNVPYMLANWSYWLRGILTPIKGNLLAFGSGAMQLVSAGIYTIDLQTLSLVSSATLGILLIAYAFDRRRFGFLPFLAPGVALLFATRELQNYFMWWPAILVAYWFAPAESPEPAGARSPAYSRLAPVTVGALVIALAGLVVVRTSRPADAVQVKVVRSEYDVGTGNVGAFVVHLENVDAERTRSVRLGVLVQGHGDDFYYWLRTPQVVRPGEKRTLRLQAPSRALQLHATHETAQVVAVDAASGTQTYSEPLELLPYFSGLANAQLRDWDGGTPALPTGWDFAESDFWDGHLRGRRRSGAWTLSFNVPPPTQAPARTVSVSQSFTGGFHRLRVRVLPYTNFEVVGAGWSLFGVEVKDPDGRRAFFAVDASLQRPRHFEEGADTVFLLPGKLNAWISILVDEEELQRVAGLHFSESRPAEFAVVGTAQRGRAGAVRGDFASATSE